MNNHGNPSQMAGDATHRGMDHKKGVHTHLRAFSLVKRPGLKKLPASNQHMAILLGLASTVRGLPEPNNSPSRQVRITMSRGLPERR